MYKRIDQRELDLQLDIDKVTYCPLARFLEKPFVREFNLDGSRYVIVITPMPSSNDIISAPYQQWTDYGYGQNPVDPAWLQARLRDNFNFDLGEIVYDNLISSVISTQEQRLAIIQILNNRISSDRIPF
jgi:hypothetical protein